MFKFTCLPLLLLIASSGYGAQDPSLLMNVSGTSADAGTRDSVPVIGGDWTSFGDGSVFAAYVTAAGPKHPPKQFFSTNWLMAGAGRTFGNRASVVLRGRLSLEPLTIPKNGYPQLLQYVTGESPDRMRPHDFVGELAATGAFRTSSSSFLHLYVAPVGEPALGPLPFAQRASAREFVEAPFGYDLEETFLSAGSVVTAGWTSTPFGVEASVFHNPKLSPGRHTTIETGSIDSRSVRVTVAPGARLTGQLSYGELGRARQLKMTSGSISYGGPMLATTALWIRRKDLAGSLNAIGLEATLHAGRTTLLGRGEEVDRPVSLLGRANQTRTTQFTFGILFDIIQAQLWRGGLGANIDYHTQTRDVTAIYGHKPQTLYVFFRARAR